MQVTFVSASMSFDAQSIFLKQPVAEASINCDPLTLRVPVRGAKSDRLLTLLVLLGLSLTCSPASAAEPLGRFFFTPAQRAQLDVARSQKSRATLASEPSEETAAQALPEILTYGGFVRRSDGKSTIWLNNRAVQDQQPIEGLAVTGRVKSNGDVTLQVPQTNRNIELKAGQSVDLGTGVIEEPFARQVTAPKPETKPAAAPAVAGRPGVTPPETPPPRTPPPEAPPANTAGPSPAPPAR